VVASEGLSVYRCCGDGIVQGAEQCDDGNQQNGDGCSSSCQSETESACCLAQGCVDLGAGAQRSCAAQGGYLMPGYSCAEVDSCGVKPVGACELDGECNDPSYQDQCEAVHGRFLPGKSCTFKPHTLTLQPDAATGKDANVNSLAAAQSINYGTQSLSAGAWTSSNTEHFIRGLVAFDLSQIPKDAVIDQATLSLYSDTKVRLYGQGTSNGLQPGHSTLSGSNDFFVRRIVSPWTEMGVTWKTQPSVTTTHQVRAPSSTSVSQDYDNLNVTDLVRDMVADPQNSHGFMLQLATEVRYREVTFTSSEDVTPARRPKLVVVYKSR
jgi:cysteine-rich repeat protein